MVHRRGIGPDIITPALLKKPPDGAADEPPAGRTLADGTLDGPCSALVLSDQPLVLWPLSWTTSIGPRDKGDRAPSA
jgi:hypothetical protein